MRFKLFSNPQALSSTLAMLGSPQPQALGFLNSVDPLASASNYYLVTSYRMSFKTTGRVGACSFSLVVKRLCVWLWPLQVMLNAYRDANW